MKAEKSFFKTVFKEYMVPDRFPLIFVNTFLAGYFFGEEGLAIFSFLLPVYYIFVVAGAWLNFGAFTMTMNSIGNDEGEIARSYSMLALKSSLTVGIILTLALEIFFPQVLQILGVPFELFEQAEAYGRTLILVGLLLIVANYILQFLKVAGMQKQLKLIYKVMLVLNAAMSFLCVKVFGMGQEGLAIGMGIAILFCLAFEGKRLLRHFGKNLFAPVQDPFQKLKNLLTAGSALAVSKIFSLSQILLFNAVCFKFYGTKGVAVFAVLIMALRVCRTASSMTLQAVTPAILVERGDHNIKAMMLILKEAIRRGLTFAGIMPMAVLWFGAEWLATKSDLSPDIHWLLIDGLKLYSLSLIFAAINAIFMTVFSALGRVGFANLIAALRSFVLIAGFLYCVVQTDETLLWWCFLFAESITFLVLIAGIFFIQKSGGYKTPLLLSPQDFRPSCYEIFDYKDENWATDKISAFLEKQKISSEKILAELQNWKKFFAENAQRKKNHFLAVHLYTDQNNLYMTLRDNGKRILQKPEGNFKYTLGLNNIFYSERITKGGN